MDPTIRIALALFISVFLGGGLIYLYRFAGKQVEARAAQLEALGRGFGLALEWDQSADMAPFRTKFPVLRGTVRGQQVKVSYGQRPNAARGEAATRTIFQVAPPDGLPAKIAIAPKAISFGKPDTASSAAFDKAFSVDGDDQSALSTWLTPSRKEALVRGYLDFEYVAFSEKFGTTLYVPALVTESSVFGAALERAVECSTALA